MLVRGSLLMPKQRDFSGRLCRRNLAVSPSLSYREPTSIVTKKNAFAKKMPTAKKTEDLTNGDLNNLELNYN